MLIAPTQFDPKKTGLSYLEFYPAHNTYHPGIDFNWGRLPHSDNGQDVVAPTKSKVIYVSPFASNGGLGQYIVMYHTVHKIWTRYAHLSVAFVKEGQELEPGEVIGAVGATGTSSPHLHFEVLTDEGIEHIQGHWRNPYNGYFAGLSRSEVASMTLDPLAWIEHAEHGIVDDWREVAKRWAIDNKIIEGGWDDPTRPMSQERVAMALKKLHDKLTS